MKVLALSGSPREDSNTTIMLKETLDELKKHELEIELVTLNDKSIAPCKACYYCVTHKTCIQTGDDFDELFDKVKEADGLILGSPVYHASTTANLKAFLDRAGFLSRWVASEMKEKSEGYDFKGTVFSGKVGAPLTVARRTGQTFAFAELLLWFTVNDFVVVGSSYWNVGVAGKGGTVDALEDEEGILNIKHFALNMASVMKKLNK